MATTITICDEVKPGTRAEPLHLELLNETLSLRELIRERVYQEVKDFNARKPHVFRGLVAPEDAERELNGWRLKAHRVLDWKKQFEAAIQSFRSGGYLVLVGDEQIDELDAVIRVNPSIEVTFLKLMPLVGG